MYVFVSNILCASSHIGCNTDLEQVCLHSASLPQLFLVLLVHAYFSHIVTPVLLTAVMRTCRAPTVTWRLWAWSWMTTTLTKKHFLFHRMVSSLQNTRRPSWTPVGVGGVRFFGRLYSDRLCFITTRTEIKNWYVQWLFSDTERVGCKRSGTLSTAASGLF